MAVEVGFETGAFAGFRLHPAERNHASALVSALHHKLSLSNAVGKPAAAAMVLSIIDVVLGA